MEFLHKLEKICGKLLVETKRRLPTPTNTNVDVVKKWKTSNAKAKFVLKRFVSHDLYDHIVGCKSAIKIWNTLSV